MFAATCIAILVTMALALARALLGPTRFDRILAVNMFGTKTNPKLLQHLQVLLGHYQIHHHFYQHL